MKKISLFLTACFVIALVACNNEETTNFGNDAVLQKSGDDIQALYNKMINTQSYIDEQAAIKQFVAQMNHPVDSYIFRDQTAMLNWISGNLGSTTFSSYQSAVDQWDNILVLGQAYLTENEGFYIAIGQNPGHYPIFDLEPPHSVSECPECDAPFKSCNDAADATLNSSKQEVGTGLLNGTMSAEKAITKLTVAQALYQSTIDGCGISYLTCCNG